MARIPQSPLPDDIADEPLEPLTEEALHWLTHLHSGRESDADWAEYQAWKAVDDAHLRAAHEAEELWEGLGLALRPDRKSSKPIPAIVAAVALAGVLFAMGFLSEPRSYFADYRTSIGERRSIALNDGAQIDMDSGTSLDVSADRRTITLHAGQVFVSVRKEPGQSFTVKAANGTVRTLGTKFAVRLEDDGAAAYVTESAVRVTYAPDAQTRSVDVSAGQIVSYGPSDGLGVPEPADIAALTSWQRGELTFNHRPLAKVAADLERYRRGKVVVVGERTGKLSLTGVFDSGDPDSVLDSIALALPVTVLKLPGLAVIRLDPTRAGPDRPPDR